MLPTISSEAEYRALWPDDSVWLPALREIAARESLDAGSLERCPGGTNLVARSGDAILKVFCPLWGDDRAIESLVTRHLAGRLGVPIPGIRAEGEFEGWPYLVLDRLEGVAIGDVWSDLERSARRSVARELGELLRRVHALPVSGLESIAVDWPAFAAGQRARLVEVQRERGLDEAWLARLPGWIDSLPPLFPEAIRPVLILADVTDEHVLLSREGGRWRIAGLIDFADALVGHAEYEFAAPATFLFRGRPEILREFLLAYGYPEEDLTPALSARIAGYTAIHRYASFAWIVRTGSREYRSMADFQADYEIGRP